MLKIVFTKNAVMKFCIYLVAEPWPSDAKLYQPNDDTQILLAESASCLAVKTYLKVMIKTVFHILKNNDFRSRCAIWNTK